MSDDEMCYVVAYNASCLDFPDALEKGKAVLLADTSDFLDYPEDVAEYILDVAVKALEYNAQITKMLPAVFIQVFSKEDVKALLSKEN